jgi:hypothetical protein
MLLGYAFTLSVGTWPQPPPPDLLLDDFIPVHFSFLCHPLTNPLSEDQRTNNFNTMLLLTPDLALALEADM